MVDRHYGIRRAYVVVLGVDAFLLLCLLVISLATKGSPMETFILLVFLLPAGILFLECLYRKVTVTGEGLAIRKLGRNRTLLWDDITRVGYLILHRKVYLLLTTVKGFFVISNAFEEFPGLVEQVAAHVEADRVEPDVRLQAGRYLKGGAHVVTAWIAALLMTVMILVKMLP